MRGSGHHATGFISGFIAAGISYKFIGNPFLFSFAAVPFSWWGGVFPDSSEFFLGFRWVRHRTVTHWVPLWIALLLIALSWPFSETVTSQLFQSSLIGFSLGGLTHLLFDWPNPRGIPFLTPWRHHSLSLWKSGKREIYIVLVWAGFASILWIPEIQFIFNGFDRLAALSPSFESVKDLVHADVKFSSP